MFNLVHFPKMISPAKLLKTLPILNPYPINPYRNFIYSTLEVFDKFKWDISSSAAVSRKNLNRIKNNYATSKAVIICNGPSLLKTNLDIPNNVFTIGLNKINLIFDHSEFRPNVIVAVNKYVISQNRDFYESTDIPLFLCQKQAIKNKLFASKTRTLLYTSSGSPGFSRDISYAISASATVTYTALQLAYFMGFSKVALIGCDHSFSTKGPDHMVVKSSTADPNHFDPRYFSGGVLWNLPSISESEESYLRAKRYFEQDKRIIFNCTVGGELELFPRLLLADFLSLE